MTQGLVISEDCVILPANNVIQGDFLMRKLGAVVLAAALVSTGAFAASGTVSPLAPGKPAGVLNAQSAATVGMVVGGIAAVGIIAAVASGGGSGGSKNNNNANGMIDYFSTTTSS